MQPLRRPPPRKCIGVIADTHGLLRPEALEALEGVDRILHAGDIGDPDHLDALARIAPVTAIRGNIDRGHWADTLPERVSLTIGGMQIYMIHDRKALQANRKRDAAPLLPLLI
ncbi:metallophosphoesterase family protein [Paracoccus marcusii]|uniref:metallophosphoesterase family protein n=1 Tax=Paracoccus marcusii TaxID=59779 RepID=UPI0035A72149